MVAVFRPRSLHRGAHRTNAPRVPFADIGSAFPERFLAGDEQFDKRPLCIQLRAVAEFRG